MKADENPYKLVWMQQDDKDLLPNNVLALIRFLEEQLKKVPKDKQRTANLTLVAEDDGSIGAFIDYMK